jgi:putative addiction module killer protein
MGDPIPFYIMSLHLCSLCATLSRVEGFPYTLEYYLTDSGEKPFKEWLDGLKDITARQKVRIRLDRVRLGNLGKNRSVGEGIYELKIDYGPGYRVYYGLDKKTVVLLLLGGDKSSQKKDITQARSYWEDHKRRKKNG